VLLAVWEADISRAEDVGVQRVYQSVAREWDRVVNMVEGGLRIVVQAAVRMRVERGSCSRVEDGKHGLRRRRKVGMEMKGNTRVSGAKERGIWSMSCRMLIPESEFDC
jgi:hypothetical protein